MQEGVTVSVPTVAAENVQMLVHAASRPIRKVVAVGMPHTKAPIDASAAALVIAPHPLIVRTAVPATKVSGAPTVRVPTAAVRKPVAVLIAVTATGADWVVTWKLPAAGLVVYRAVEPNAAAVAGHAGVPPPPVGVAAGNVKAPVPTLKTTRWNAVSVPTAAVIVFAAEKVAGVMPAGAVEARKLPAWVPIANKDTPVGSVVGHAAVGVEPEPENPVAEPTKVRGAPAVRVPTAA